MIQLQVINDILHNNNLMDYLGQNIEAKYFMEYGKEFNFITNYYDKYNKVPELKTFLNEFPNFEVIEVMEPVNYLSYNLKEEYLYVQLSNNLKKWSKLIEDNALIGLGTIMDECNSLFNEVAVDSCEH